MSGITLKSILELANSNDAKPSTKITFRMAGVVVDPKSVGVQFFRGGGYSSRPDEIEVQVSEEWIERRVKERMRKMFDAQVEAMFVPKEVADGS